MISWILFLEGSIVKPFMHMYYIACFIKILISNFLVLLFQLLGWEFIRHCPKKLMKKIICASLGFPIYQCPLSKASGFWWRQLMNQAVGIKIIKIKYYLMLLTYIKDFPRHQLSYSKWEFWSLLISFWLHQNSWCIERSLEICHLQIFYMASPWKLV